MICLTNIKIVQIPTQHSQALIKHNKIMQFDDKSRIGIKKEKEESK